jgi:hypothetical protein
MSRRTRVTDTFNLVNLSHPAYKIDSNGGRRQLVILSVTVTALAGCPKASADKTQHCPSSWLEPEARSPKYEHYFALGLKFKSQVPERFLMIVILPFVPKYL